LLHTWSLAIEEQFYLGWPVLLLLMRKIGGGRAWLVVVGVTGLTVLSFCLGLYALRTEGMSGFYLVQDRAWELLIGGALAMMKRKWMLRLPTLLAELLPLLGLIAIGYAAVRFGHDAPYPGFPALLPVFGAFAYLLPVGQRPILHRVASARPIVLLGKCSYSVYLYHWPLLVFWLHYSGFGPLSSMERVALLAGSCSLGWLSWRFVETPFRSPPGARRILAAFVSAQVALGIACATIEIGGGFPDRISGSVRSMASLDIMWDWTCPRPNSDEMTCETGAPWDSATYRVVLIGDSNASHFLPVLASAARDRDISIRMFRSCTPAVDGRRTTLRIPNDPTYNDRCAGLYGKMLSYVRSVPDATAIILASAWSSVALYVESSVAKPGKTSLKIGVDDVIADLRAIAPATPIALISDLPRWEIDPIPCVLSQQTTLLRRRCKDDRQRLDLTLFNRDQRAVHDLLRSYDGTQNIVVVSPEDYLCTSSDCAATINGEFIYRDSGHLRRNLNVETLQQLAGLLHFGEILTLTRRVAAAKREQIGDRPSEVSKAAPANGRL
jgi:hypothetical protein